MREQFLKAFLETDYREVQILRIDLTLGFPDEWGLQFRYQALFDVWSKLMQSQSAKKAKNRHNFQYLRVLEEKYGSNGWNPHLHVLVVADKTSAVEVVQGLVNKWVEIAVGIGLRADLHQQAYDVITRTEIRRVIYYLTKNGRVSLGIDFAKWNPKIHPVTPMELLQAVVVQESEELMKVWLEYEQASYGKRRYTWSRGLICR